MFAVEAYVFFEIAAVIWPIIYLFIYFCCALYGGSKVNSTISSTMAITENVFKKEASSDLMTPLVEISCKIKIKLHGYLNQQNLVALNQTPII